MSSLVPGYMAVSWTVSPPAVGVRVTCGVEGRPEGEGRGGGGGGNLECKSRCTELFTQTHQGEA